MWVILILCAHGYGVRQTELRRNKVQAGSPSCGAGYGRLLRLCSSMHLLMLQLLCSVIIVIIHVHVKVIMKMIIVLFAFFLLATKRKTNFNTKMNKNCDFFNFVAFCVLFLLRQVKVNGFEHTSYPIINYKWYSYIKAGLIAKHNGII